MIAGLNVRLHVPLHAEHFIGKPDLVDVDRRIILEPTLSSARIPPGTRTDARRYNSFVVAGWVVLRFSWEDVMHHPDDVLRVLRAVASQGRTDLRLLRPEPCAWPAPRVPVRYVLLYGQRPMNP